jgi:signal transduction histidine kinase
LNPVLKSMAAGELRLTTVFSGPAGRVWPGEFGLSNIAYIVVVDASGRVLGSSDPSGSAFAPPERAEWQQLVGADDPNGVMRVRGGAGPAALGAATITDGAGRHIADVIVATTTRPLPPNGGAVDVLRGLAIFGAASVAVLCAASVFALTSSSVVAYLLSRRLTRRLERLGQAAQALAAGDLSQRVDAGSDEVGQLARQFNSMAADLERSLGELRAERDRVTGLLDERRQLIASASHELRTPVATVRGYLESARAQDNLPHELAADLDVMEREVLRLQELIEDLFALSQAAVGRLSLRLEPTDAGAVVQRLVETSAPLAWRQRRVQVLAELGDAAAPKARADKQRLEQVVSNLLGNAIRHTPPGGIVAAGVHAVDGVVQVEVRDTGSGIAPDDLPRVFERFFRGKASDGAGAGLGLALVKELSEAMGGSVAVSSTQGEGSSFVVTLPRA